MTQFIAPTIASVGVDNTEETLFERQYPLHGRGMSYNSYAIIDTQIAIMDSVEAGQGDLWISNILAATGGRTPDYLVVQHMEPDHSASIMIAAARWPQMKVVASAKAHQMLTRFFPDAQLSPERILTVGEGDTLSLGSHTLQFFTAPMIHWPEVIVSYETTTATLFSADAFGKFGAISLTRSHPWAEDARRYFINIVGKYGPSVQTLLKKISTLPAVNTIAPLHGPALTGSEITEAIRLYKLWSSYTHETPGVLVAHASIYGGTAEAAHQFAQMLRDGGAPEVVEIDLTEADQSEAVAQAFRLSHLVVAAPTYDAAIYPPMHDFLHHLTLKNYRNRHVAIIENGSWAPTAGRQMRTLLESLPGITIIEPIVTITSRLKADTTTQLHQLATNLLATLQ